MKLLLGILLLYINYVICLSHKYAVKSFPKKVKPYAGGKIMIHSGKYVYRAKNGNYSTPPGYTMNDFYTVFQVVGNSKVVHGVPDSPYFSVDQTVDQKPRVKKVLPDYIWPRHKRSAAEPKAEVESTTKDVSTTEKSVATTTETTTTAQTTTEKATTKKEQTTKKVPTTKKVQTTKKAQTTKKVQTTKKGETTKKATQLRSNTKSKDDDAKKNNKKEGNVARAKDNKKNTEKPKSKPKAKGVARHQNKKKNGNKPKTRTRGKGKNGTATAKPKEGAKRQGKRSSPKRSKKGSNTRQAKKKQPKRPKTNKKQPARKGNMTNLKIPKETRRLTSAREALIEDYPYVVSIQKDEEHWCAGALLNPRIVITTANCLWKSNRLSRMTIRAGSSYTDHGGQVAQIQEVMKHPRWGLRKNPDNDVALILLDRNIRFSHSVHGVDLPNRIMMPAFEDAWVTSWGSERRDGIFDIHENSLQVYHSYLISNESCNNVTRRFGITVSPNFVCFSQSGKTAPCTRDTGAPAVSDGVLWGLASWGIRKLCGTERFPAMFSYTASHSNMDFITNATTYLMSDQRHYPFVDRPKANFKGPS